MGNDGESLPLLTSMSFPGMLHASTIRSPVARAKGLRLDHVAEGLYQLVAFPLKLDGADAAPTRAVLVAQE